MSIGDPSGWGSDVTDLVKLLNQIDIPWNLIKPIQDEIDEIAENQEEASAEAMGEDI